MYSNVTPFFAWLTWNPSRNAFTLPYFNHTIAWYGIIFSLGFILAYLITQKMVQQVIVEKTPLLYPAEDKNSKDHAGQISTRIVDKLTWFLVAGTLIGARLGEVFFYDWPSYKQNPLDILKIWQGGLASHGGAAGILLALALFCRLQRPVEKFSFLTWLDLLVVPIALVSALIRIGNFFNQEILGPPTDLPWGIIFLNPLDGSEPVPRHPAQLYEAATYFCTFLFLSTLWARGGSWWNRGRLSGLFLTLVFSARFFLEFLKLPLSNVIDESFLHMGQYLSLPFIAAGIALIVYSFLDHRQASGPIPSHDF